MHMERGGVENITPDDGTRQPGERVTHAHTYPPTLVLHIYIMQPQRARHVRNERKLISATAVVSKVQIYSKSVQRKRLIKMDSAAI